MEVVCFVNILGVSGHAEGAGCISFLFHLGNASFVCLERAGNDSLGDSFILTRTAQSSWGKVVTAETSTYPYS